MPEKKRQHLLAEEGLVVGSLGGQHLNECAISSLLELGYRLWKASQGRGLEWVSDRKFWAVYAYIAFLSHPKGVINKHNVPLFE